MVRIFASRLGRLLLGVWVVMLVTSLSGLNLVPAAHRAPATISTLKVVLINSTDGQAHWGQSVTFNVSTTATTEPNVSLSCYQSGTLVFSGEAGFYAGYPWPGSQTFILSSPSWTSGAASCTASLYYFGGRKTVTLASLSIPVAA